jgi:2-keto-4-pentenoate hydratase/2-oxohepta-3-ene-1,7-dioic acid hydratase in catechol pathway
MRYLSFYYDQRVRPGFIDDGRIVAIACDSLLDYMALPAGDRARRHTRETFDLTEVRLAAPVRPRKNVFCVGRNYLEHAKEGARALGRDLNLPDVPTFFTKSPTAIADPDATLEFDSRVSPNFDWEAELAVVIGAKLKDATEQNALQAVFGYTALNDISARDLQRQHGQWFKGKSIDASCPIGPWIVTPDGIGDPQRLRIELKLNGVVKQQSNTEQMIFKLPRIIAELSRGMTLEPGDVIATGTPEGVGFARTPPEFFASGDIVEIEIENIGVLRNAISIR